MPNLAKIVLLCLLFCVVFVLSLMSGYDGLVLGNLFAIFEPHFRGIFFEIRLPQSLGAVSVGAALGVSGALMQAVLRNPLASPFTLGIAQASAFGASFAIIVLQSYGVASFFGGEFVVALYAFGASVACALLILFLGAKKAMLPQALILLGVALGAFFGALGMLLQYFAQDVDVAATLFWSFGDVAKISLVQSTFIGLTLAGGLLYFGLFFYKLDALLLADAHAKTLGVNVEKFRLWVMLYASLLSALSVAYVGIIGFVGLMAPHIVRLFIGESHRYLLHLSALMGAILLLIAHILSKLLLAPLLIPVGILTSLVGAVLFVYLLLRGRG